MTEPVFVPKRPGNGPGGGLVASTLGLEDDLSSFRANDIVAVGFSDRYPDKRLVVFDRVDVAGFWGYVLELEETSESPNDGPTLIRLSNITHFQLVATSGSVAQQAINQLVFKKRQLEARLVRIEDRLKDLLQ